MSQFQEVTPALDDSSDAAETPDIIQISAVLAPQINFACHQNALPLIRQLIIRNSTTQEHADLRLTLKASPGFVASRSWQIDRLLAGGELVINERDVRLDGDYLMGLEEKQQGELHFSLTDAQGQQLAELSHPVEVLARNEWGGYGYHPSLLAAFCLPNQKSVELLLRESAEILRHNGHPGQLKNYADADARRIWLQASAIWQAVLALQLDYAYPPSSFEQVGQKVRTPDMIRETHRATCLDTSLLFAALFEQMGLHPLLVIEKGHSYVGLWLKDDNFARAYSEDELSLRKRVELDEVLVFETTLVCQGMGFPAAIKHARDKLAGEASNFVGVLDIARARDEKIYPLALVARGLAAEIPETKEPGIESGGGSVSGLALPPDDLTVQVEVSSEPATAEGRLDQWQRRLLDLSLRNPLLNLRNTKSNIPLIAPDPARLEDVLASGKALSLESMPGFAERDAQIHAERTGEKLDEQIALGALSRNKIYVAMEPLLLDACVTELYRKSKADLEEGGANTLFLAIGLLRWRRPDNKEKWFRAPLILVPVTVSRKSITSGIKLTLHDDEPRFNTTLLEMLRQDFALDIQGLDGPLPTDEAGIDIQGLLDRMRREVLDADGFEVLPQVMLGTFSFAKYLMWKDLVDRTEQLKQNRVVRHLLETPRERFSAAGTFVSPRELDSQVQLQSLFTPLSSDSSQLAAIVSSAQGQDFVLVGPPGTGKSQTIANMIAHNLALGRTVLFVSEKAAALDVVYRRLREHGLGEFCLELHSNKARKLDVIRQLGEAWDAQGELSEAEWAKETQRLQGLRDELNQYVAALHARHNNGLSVRQALERAVGYPELPDVPLAWATLDQHDEAGLEQLLSIGERIELNAGEVGDVSEHPLGLVHADEWSHGWQQTLLRQASELAETTQAYRVMIAELTTELEFSWQSAGSAQLEALGQLVRQLQQAAGLDLAFAFAPNASEQIAAVAAVCDLLGRFAEQQSGLSVSYPREKALELDLDLAESWWQRSEPAWFGKKWWLQHQCRRYLRKHGGALGKPEPGRDLPLLAQMQQLHRELGAKTEQVERIPGWRGLDSDTGRMLFAADVAQSLRAANAALARNSNELIALRATLRKWVVEANELLAPEGTFGLLLHRFQESEQAFKRTLGDFANLAQRSPHELLDEDKADLERLQNRMRDLAGAQSKLNSWCAWRRVRGQAVSLGLLPLVEAIEAGIVPSKQARQAVETNYCRWWAAGQIDQHPMLRQFVSVEHEQKILHFRELDDKVRKLTSAYIRARIRQGSVGKEDAKRNSEYGVIRRELEKKTRHKPLRQLISETSSAITSLTPCLLMSPLSIAQYLPADQPPFDLVIFDEASQITTWDAIGAIARGKQTVVAGDPKQLPPTSFFSAAQSQDEEIGDDEDLESILDEMLGANLPKVNLTWHYRSRNESLITFSNHRYYGGSLVTFPSPVTRDCAVSLRFVGGAYARGVSQVNQAEAEAVVAEVEHRLAEHPDVTLGVVTFNQKQQNLILDLLDQARRRSPGLDRHFDEALTEPVFVKNLESVQGDERDVILFSTTFGPDSAGRLSMNFGPLNQSGGERRLNVAITRARSELKVFTSIRPEQMDLSRSGALGVRDLKHFLEFAERGHKALEAATFGSVGSFDSPFEEVVARALQEKGWLLQPQVGVSRFRIDLGVVHPDEPGRYLAGIECDGATYHRSATARDRDKIREGVLRGLGWEILRLWSTDYWIDPLGTVEKLHGQLEALLGRDRLSGADAAVTLGPEE